MYSSFYGGRDGRPFDIKKTYASVEEMQDDFSNPAFEEVGLGEFVYIETPNKRDEDYGSLYRRDAGTATYIGCVAGPDGDVPLINFVTPGTFNQLCQTVTNDVEVSTGQWSLDAGSLISGKEQSTIDYRILNYRDDYGVPRGAIDLHFPTPAVEITANNPAGSREEDKFIFTKTSSNNNPFFHEFKLTIPEKLTKQQIKVTTQSGFNNNAIREEIANGGIVLVLRDE